MSVFCFAVVMLSTWWLLLLGAVLSHLVVAQEQPLPDEEEDASEDSMDLSNVLKRAQGALIRSLLRRIEEEQSDRGNDFTWEITSPGVVLCILYCSWMGLSTFMVAVVMAAS